MMKTKILFMLAALCVSASMTAQESATLPHAEGVETSVSADVVSQYVWRGQDLGSAAVQPSLGVAWRGLSLSAWGSYALTDPSDTKELDLTLAYTVGGLNIGITDYWFNAGLDPQNRYFRYGVHSTNHVFEANAGYDFGVLSLQWFTNFTGNDGTNKSGDRAYSSYAEVSAPFRLGGADWTATIGAVPFATDFYAANGFAVTNISLKATAAVRVSDAFSLPVFAQIAANPCAEKAYLVLGFSLKP